MTHTGTMSGRVVNVRPKPGYAFDAARASIQPLTTDSLGEAIGRYSRPHFGAGQYGSPYGYFGRELALAAYQASGILKKVIAIPAEDRVREWRDWQAPAEIITKIEAEEKRLNIQAKAKYGEVMRGVGGGALILVTKGNGPNYHAEELSPDTMKEGDLVAVNIVSRRQLECKEFIRDVASPRYGEPEYFEIATEGGNRVRIHPSRVVCFRGEPFADSLTVSDLDAFWGDCTLTRVFREAERADNTQEWFAALVRKAKLLRIGIPDLIEMSSTTKGRADLNARIALIAEGESSLNATVYRSGTGTDDPGEKLDDYQITWAGIPAMMDAFDQRLAAVSDIPFTRLMSRSPSGMNATGKSDQDNWNKMVAAGQKIELRPCLDQLDRALLPSAGVKFDDPKITWKFAPLELPDEKTEAETFKIVVDALEKLDLMGALPEEAFKELAQNLLAERQWLPGMDSVMKKFSDDEKFGPDEDDGTDPSAIQSGGGDPDLAGQGGARGPAVRAADAAPRTCYVRRDVLPETKRAIGAWAKAQGLPAPHDDLHTTIAYSRTPVDWIKMGQDWRDQDGKGGYTVTAGGPRVVEPLGDQTAVLMFASSDLSWRNREMRENGASWDYPDFQPHISLTDQSVDLMGVEPFRGEIKFGPEIFAEISGA